MHTTRIRSTHRLHFLNRSLPEVQRKHSDLILALTVALDFVVLWMAFWSAYEIRYGLEIGGTVFPWDRQDFSAFYGRAALFAAISIALFGIRGIYRLPKWTTLLDEFMSIAGAVTVAMGVVILSNYLSQFNPSRLLFVYAWFLAMGYLLIIRTLRRFGREALWARSIGVERVLIIGSGDVGRRIIQSIHAAPDAGLRVEGFLAEQGSPRMVTVGSEQGVTQTHRLGVFSDLHQVLHRYSIDQVIIAVNASQHDQMMQLSDECRAEGVPFQIVPDLFQLSLDRAALTEFAGIPLLGTRQMSITGGDARTKRAFDLTMTLIVLLVTILPISMAYAISSRRQGVRFDRLERVGRNGRLFGRIRFSAAPSFGPAAEAVADPGAVTSPSSVPAQRAPGLAMWVTGYPVLWNVLRGEMSLVGPLPHSRAMVSQYESWHRQRLKSTPGITGLWRVYRRTDLTFDEMVRLDLYYAEHWSIWLDVKILLRSTWRLRRGAYGRQ
ncbi:sugar transferase [soil metagenome]